MALIVLTSGDDERIQASGDLRCDRGHQISPACGGTPEGIYLRWTWTGADLGLEQDRYGLYPSFVARTERQCVLSTDLGQLLEHGVSREFDDDALAVFVRLGFFVGGDTPFAAVRAMPPGAVVQYGASGFRVSGRLPVRPALQQLSRADAVEALIASMERAIARRRPHSTYQLPLSGGRDSRHILLALVDAGCPPDACITVEHFPPRASHDATIAAELCRRLGLPHVVLPQRDRMCAEHEKNRRTHFCSDEHAQFVTLADHLAMDTLETYDGIGGDVLSQSSYLTPDAVDTFERGDAEEAAEFLLDGYGVAVSEAALDTLLSPRLRRRLGRDRAIARLAREIRHHLDAPNPIASFFFWNRTRREVALAPYGLLRDVVVHAPYLDHGVFDLLMSLPVRSLLDRQLHSEAIAVAYPGVRDVPYARRGLQRRPRRAEARRLAYALTFSALRARRLLNPHAMLPGLAATLVDGRAGRLWHTSLSIYLAQLAALATRA